MEINGAIITGGGGFLGSHLAETLISAQIPVVCVDNFSTGLRSNKDYLLNHKFSANLQFIEADVSKSWDLWTSKIDSEKLKKITHVFHFASPASPPHYQRLAFETMAVNTTGLMEALAMADKYSARVVFASTSEIYGDPNITPQPESYFGNVNTMGPRSCYDEAKRFGETIIYTHNQKHQTRHGLVRIFNTYGPRMNPNDGRVIINFLVQAMKKQKLTIYGDGQQTRSFCFVDDLISGILKYAKTELTIPVNVGNQTEFTIQQLADEVRNIFLKDQLQFERFDLPKDDPKQRCPDLTLAKRHLNNWEPKIQLSVGLVKMLEWLKTQNLDSIQAAGRPQ